MIEGPVTVEKFINLVSLAWKQLWIYPEGHPARAGAVERAFAMLRVLVAPTGSLVFGVDREALICAGDRLTDTNAQQLAGQLFRRNVAVVRFEEGVVASDLEHWLALLHPDPLMQQTSRLWDQAAAAGIRHIAMEPVDFSGVEASDDLDTVVEKPEAEETPRTLWQRILHNLMEEGRRLESRPSGQGGSAGGGLGQVIQLLRGLITEGEDTAGSGEYVAAGAAGEAPSPQDAAKARRRRMSHLSEQLAAAVAGHLPTGAGEVKGSDLRQVAELVKALPASMRPRVIDAAARRLAGEKGRPEGLKLMAASSSAAEVVSSLRRLRGEGFQFSEHALTIVDALAWSAAGQAAAEAPSSSSERDHQALELRKFFQAEDLDSFPRGEGAEGHEPVLLKLPVDIPVLEHLPAEIEETRRSLSDQYQTKTLSLTLLDLIARAREPEAADPLIDRLGTVFATLVASGQLTAAQAIVSFLRQLESDEGEAKGARGAAGRALHRLSGTDGAVAIVDYISSAGSEDYEKPKRLVDSFGGPMVRSLLSALSEEEDMVKRRRLLSFITSLGGEVEGFAVAALSDSRWFVVRNMLALLRDVGGDACLPGVRQTLGHENAKVRIEAIKTLAQLDSAVPRDLVERAMADPDPQVAELAITALGAHAGVALDLLIQLLRKRDPLARQRNQRLKAFKTLGTIGDPRALDQLSRYSNQFFVFDHLSERRAAFEALTGYSPEARRAWLKKGRKSKDPEIQAVCKRLWAEDDSEESH
ncbi:MAG: HEAT repeat domain-containing protein [Thermoanaerobaculia bacterium]|nr:HEAT repeat domain-containing protein [Thermoanaerobaculia bacterium]